LVVSFSLSLFLSPHFFEVGFVVFLFLFTRRGFVMSGKVKCFFYLL
jgi:hypothetical protein